MKRFFFNTYFFLIIAFLATFIGVGSLSDHYVERKYPGILDQNDQNLSRGTFYLIEQELLKVDESQYQQVIDRLQNHFGYPLQIHNLNTYSLSKKERIKLETKEIVRRDDGNFHIKKIADTDFAISMGPFEYLQFRPSEIIGFLLTTGLVFGLIILSWSFFFWRRLNRFKDATQSLAEGDFSARVEVSTLSSLSAIATGFNTMATRIEKLILSHKQLVNAVSHELRTPISRIRFGLECLGHTKEKEQNSHLSGIRSDVDELDDLVNELLSYARFERMETPVNLSNRELLPWLREYMHVAREIIEVPLEFSHWNISDTDRIPFDPRLLERAIHNLLQNGSRYARKELHVKIFKEENWVSIAVEDDGPGIPEKDRERLFEPFIRLDSSRNRANGGYGLGLAIVREIIHGHSGTISCIDSQAGGAAFQIRLPLPE